PAPAPPAPAQFPLEHPPPPSLLGVQLALPHPHLHESFGVWSLHAQLPFCDSSFPHAQLLHLQSLQSHKSSLPQEHFSPHWQSLQLHSGLTKQGLHLQINFNRPLHPQSHDESQWHLLQPPKIAKRNNKSNNNSQKSILSQLI